MGGVSTRAHSSLSLLPFLWQLGIWGHLTKPVCELDVSFHLGKIFTLQSKVI